MGKQHRIHMYTVHLLVQMSQEPEYRISSLEGQLRLCQEKLAETFTHNSQVLVTETHHRYIIIQHVMMKCSRICTSYVYYIEEDALACFEYSCTYREEHELVMHFL